MLTRARRTGGAAAVLNRARRTGGAGTPDPVLPSWMRRMDAARSVVAWVEADSARAPSIREHPALSALGGLEGALAYLNRRWVTAFGVALDEELDAGAPPGPATLARVCRRVAADQPGLTLILEHHASHPAVREGRENHRRLLENGTGGPTQGGPTQGG